MKAEPQYREKVAQPAAQGEVQRKTGEIGDQELMNATPAQRQVAALAQMAEGSARGAQLRQFAEMAKGAPQVRQLQAVREMAAQQAPKRNETGLPDNLKSGVEALSGISMDDVRVHYNSSKPAQLNALAYAQGSDIHVGPGQEKHLPHEAWHVVQQAQGRVRATGQLKGGVVVNDDIGLEKEADIMGSRSTGLVSKNMGVSGARASSEQRVMQPKLYESAKAKDSLSENHFNKILEAVKDSALKARLIEAYHDEDNDYYVDFRGSLRREGAHELNVMGVRKFVATSSYGFKGKGGLSAVADDSALGFGFNGRPGWSKEVLECIKTIKGQENIRHIIPYHYIKERFEAYLEGLMLKKADANGSDVVNELKSLAADVGSQVSEQKDLKRFLVEQSMMILGRLNSVPGNLWAGSAEENQRINTLRLRINAIIKNIEGLKSKVVAGEKAHEMLDQSLENAGSKIYQELILGVKRVLPAPDSADFSNTASVIYSLKFAMDNCEIDAMPSMKELRRIPSLETFYLNFPKLGDALRLFYANNFVDAVRIFANLESPY